MNNIAIIPARSGSKRLEDKNIKLLNGKPLIAYTIEVAIKSGMFNTLCVSTDSEKYAEISRKLGAEVPFLRSRDNSSDLASSWDVIKEVLNHYSKMGKVFDTFMLLQPTSPLRESNDIISAYNLMHKMNAKAIVSVCEMEHSPLFCNTLPEDGSMVGFLCNDGWNKPSQQLEKYYRINGAIYLSEVSHFMSTNNIYSSDCYAYIMCKGKSIDIDTELDFCFTEFLLQKEN